MESASSETNTVDAVGANIGKFNKIDVVETVFAVSRIRGVGRCSCGKHYTYCRPAQMPQ